MVKAKSYRIKKRPPGDESTELLRKHRKLYSYIYAHLKIPVLILDHNWNFMEQNQEHRNFFGYSDKELSVDPLKQIFTPAQLEIVKNEVEEDEYLCGELELKNKNGLSIYTELTAFPFLSQEGGTENYILFFIDRTEIKHLHKTLTLSQDNFQTIFFNAPEAIFIFEADTGQILNVNPFVCKMLAYTREELLELTVATISSKADGSDERQAKKSVYGYATDLMLTREVKYRGKEGREICTEITGSNVKYQKMNCILVFARDISEKKRIEKALLQSKKKAEEAAVAKSAFLANMSHEIRTPMNAILGMNSLLSQTNLNDEQSEYVEDIRSSSEMLLSLLNDILDFSKIEAGKIELETIKFKLGQIVEEVAAMTAFNILDKEIEILSYLDPRLPHFYKGDPTRIRQIITNLANNAVKFTEKGEVVISAKLITICDGEAEIRISVSDTGIGISQKNQLKLFQAFSQVDVSTTRRYGGTGLGLSITKELVELMKGTITLKSCEKKGTTFHVNLKLPVLDKTFSQERQTSENPPLKILLFSQNKTLTKIIRNYCESYAHSNGTKLSLRCFSHVDQLESSLSKLKSNAETYPSTPKLIFDHNNSKSADIIWEKVCRQATKPPLNIIVLVRQGVLNQRFRQRCVLDKTAILVIKKPVKKSSLKRIFSDADLPTSPDKKKTKKDQKETLKGGHILVVDDVFINRKLTSRFLEIGGYTSEMAANGQEAVLHLKKNPCDLVLMDCSMPIMDGYQAATAIREDEKINNKSRTPIIAMSAHAMKGDRDKAISAGMDDYLVKPVEQKMLISKIKKWLKQ